MERQIKTLLEQLSYESTEVRVDFFNGEKLDVKEKKVYGMRARVILVIECAIAGVFSVTGYSLIVKGLMVAHIVLASGLILGWIKIFFDKELEVTNYR